MERIRPVLARGSSLALAAVLLVTGCAGGAASSMQPSSAPLTGPPSTSAASATTTPTIASTKAPTPAPTAVRMADGEPWLMYGWYSTGDRKVAYIVRPDGTGRHRIIPSVTGDIRSPSWAPDGERIVFVVRDATYPDGAIWTADVDDDDAALFYDGRDDGCESVFHPVWSPDGTRIALVCYHGRESDLAVLEVASMRLETVATYSWPAFLDNPSSWSHDGKEIAFDVLHWDPTDKFIEGSYIATVPADGSAPANPLTERSSNAVFPSWSPDDQELVYNTYDLGNNYPGPTSNLFRISPDGTGVKQLTTAPPGGTIRIAQPQWDPDGKRIWVTYVSGGDFHPAWVDRATGEVTTIDVVGSRAVPRPLP